MSKSVMDDNDDERFHLFIIFSTLRVVLRILSRLAPKLCPADPAAAQMSKMSFSDFSRTTIIAEEVVNSAPRVTCVTIIVTNVMKNVIMNRRLAQRRDVYM